MSSSEDPHADDPLPPGWTRQFSKSNQKYFYFHKATAVTQWHFPTASEAKDPTVAKRRFEQAKERDKKRAANLPTATDDDGGSSSGVPADHNTANHKRPRHSSHTTVATVNKKAYSNNKNDFDSAFLELADKTSVAIIVPYRDLHVAQQRAAHLQQFVPHMIHFLNNCRADGLVSDYHIYIIEQSPSDGYKFNRGKLLNIGFDLARKSQRQHDVYIFHDVDLLPGDDLKPWYAKFPKTPIHIARVWDRYSGNPKYFGGVVSFSSSDYKRINGVRCCFTFVCLFL